MLVNPYIFSVAGASGALDSYLSGLKIAASPFKKLVGAYAGAAMRVRRSSDDTESDIGFAAGVLDATALLAFTGSANGYASYDKVALYVPVTGSSGSTAFRCVKGHTCTAVADAQVSTTLGFPTALFDGNGDRIDITVSRSVQLGSGDFRIRCKINAVSIGVRDIAGGFGVGAAGSLFYMQLNNGLGQIEAGIYSGSGTAGVCTSANAVILAATSYDVEYGRSGTSFQLSVNGVSVATATSSSAANVGPDTLYIGGEPGGPTFSFNGHIWGFSIEPGVAGHLGSFTPDALYGTEGDGFVSKIYDQSGGGFDFAQSTKPLQPRIVSNASALADITFDGADDYLLTGSNGGTPTAITAFFRGNYRLDTIAAVSWNSLQLPLDFSNGHGCYVGANNTNGIGWGVSDGTGNRLTITGPNDSNVKTLGSVAGKFDKSQTTTAKRRAFYAGTEITTSQATGGAGTVGTGAFDAGIWYAGGLPAAIASCGPLNARSFVVYEVAKSDADIALISTALA